MRLGITLNRIGNAWQVTHLPSVPLADQLADFKAKQVAGEFGDVDEVVIWSSGDPLKRYVNKTPVAKVDSPKPKKK